MIITLTGDNGYQLGQELNKLTNDFVAKHGDMGLEKLNAAEVEYTRLTEAVSVLPFLVDQKLVVIDQPSANKDLATKIEAWLNMINPTTDVILVEPKFDKRSQLYKLLKKQTDFREFNEVDGPGLGRWLVSYTAEQGGQISPGDANYLIQRASASQLRLKNEIDKLISFDPQISRANIDLLVVASPKSSIFDLLDATLSGNSQRAMQLYDEQRQQKVEPQAILALLAWQLHILAIVKAAGNKPTDAIASEAKLSPFVVRKSAGSARRLTLTQLKDIVERTLSLDIQLKRESIDADDALKTHLLSIAQTKQ